MCFDSSHRRATGNDNKPFQFVLKYRPGSFRPTPLPAHTTLKVWFRKTEAFHAHSTFQGGALDLRHKHPLAFSHVFTRYNAFSLCSANTLLLLSCNPEKREMQEQKACKSLLVHRDSRQDKGRWMRRSLMRWTKNWQTKESIKDCLEQCFQINWVSNTIMYGACRMFN